MDIEAFLLCDCATDTNGKLNVLGAFDTIFAPKLPTVYPAIAIAIRIRFSSIEQGEHEMRINVIDQDANPIAPKLQGKITVQLPEDADSKAVNIVLHLQRLELKSYGQYRIDFALDARHEASLPFCVRKPYNKTQYKTEEPIQ